MKNKQLLLICIIILYSPIQGICQKKSDIIIDFSKIIGKIKPLNGVNNGPFVTGVNADLVSYHAEAGFPFTRLHDAHWPSPDVVDIPVISRFLIRTQMILRIIILQKQMTIWLRLLKISLR